MEGIACPDWKSFEHQLQLHREVLAESAPDKRCPELLFRGQSDSEWELTTTLERAGRTGMTFREYCRVIYRVKPAVETFTGVKWDVPDYSIELEESFRNDRELVSLGRFPSVPLYRYLVYLRHHGFPSPLLDWTASMHVAAFFAFREKPDKAQARSIYVYCERPEGLKGGAVGESAMRAIGPYVRSHRRHFRQRSDYTICGNFEPGSGWHFHPHDPVFWNRWKGTPSRPASQDFLFKFDIPTSERIGVLRRLDEYNLNAFSLYETEETLLETMWFREHDLKSLD